jgi:chromosome segregation ATPase
MGKMFISYSQIGKGETEVVEKKLADQKSIIEEDLSSQVVSIGKLEDTIKNINVNISEIEELYQRSLPGIESILVQINKYNDIATSSIKRFDELTKKVESTYEDINRKADELSNKVDTLSTTAFDRTVEESKQKIISLTKEINEAHSAIHSIESSVDESFKVLFKNIDAQAEELKKQTFAKKHEIINQLKASDVELDAISKVIQEKGREVKSTVAELNNFKLHRESARRALNIEKAEFNDFYQKVHKALLDSKDVVDKNSAELISKINELKGSFGETAQVSDKIMEIKGEITNIQKQIEGTRKEIESLQLQLRALDAAKNEPISSKINKIKTINDKSKRTKSSISKIKSDVQDISKKLAK